ncbi:hypothetical protein EDD18DRAFT_1177074, partial [Armillaria luteobubalina]
MAVPLAIFVLIAFHHHLWGLCQAQPAREIGVAGPIGYLCLHRYSCPPFHSWKCSSINCCCSIEFFCVKSFGLLAVICRFLWYT